MKPAAFQQEVEEAFARQLHEHEKSMSRFFGTVATLCDQAGMSAPLIADTFRALPAMGDMPPLARVEVPVNEHHPNKIVEHCDHSIHDDGGLDSVMQENQIKPLTFLSTSGEIASPPGPLERICGPSYAMMKSRLMAPFECCQPRTGISAKIVDGMFFKILTMVVIMLNFAFIIAQSDYKASHLNEGENSTMVTIGHAFTAFYVFELCAVMFVHGKLFFTGPEKFWNLFDTVIVLVALFDILMGWLGIKGFNMSFLRVLRFFKISRVLRMFSALRTFKEIRIMVDALVGCLSLFLFCACLMTIFLSVFAIFFVQGASELLENATHLDAEVVLGLRANWCSVSDAMLQLFQAITGGNDWMNIFNIVKEIGMMHAFLFIFLVCFYQIAFFNVITSVFCEKAMSLATPTSSELIARRIEKEHHDASELMTLMRKSLLTHDGSAPTISAKQVGRFVNNPEVELYFNVRGLKASSAHKLHRMLCEIHSTDDIQIGEFISALVKLDGPASSIDAHCLQVRQLHGLHQMKTVQKETHAEMAGLRSMLRGIHREQSFEVPVEGHLYPPLFALGVEHSPKPSSVMPLKQGQPKMPDDVPVLKMMNDTLNVLKELVHDSAGVCTVSNVTLKAMREFAPSCCTSVPEDEPTINTNVDIDDTSVVLEERPSTPEQTQMRLVQRTISEELLQMQRTLEDIQQTIPPSDPSLRRCNIVPSTPPTTIPSVGGDGGSSTPSLT